MYSSKPTASIMIREVVAENNLPQPEGQRRLNAAGLQAVEAVAQNIATTVDALLGKQWNRKAGSFVDLGPVLPLSGNQNETEKAATCSCGSGIPVQKVQIDGQEVSLIALPLIFKQFRLDGKQPSDACARELLDTVVIYNPIPEGMDERYLEVLLQEYEIFWDKETA